MSSTSKTPNYSLSQWAAGDTLTHVDVNEDNAKIDAAIKQAANDAAAVSAKLVSDGYCRVQVGTYNGTGVSGAANPNSLTFNFTPKIVIVRYRSSGVEAFGAQMVALWGFSTQAAVHTDYSSTDYLYLSYSGNTIQWYCTAPYKQLNDGTSVYAYVAIG